VPSLNGRTITLVTPVTLGTLGILGGGAATSFTLSGSSMLFDNGASAAQLQFAGNNVVTIGSALTFNRDLSLNGSASSARLVLAGSMGGTGKVVKSGPGAATFAGTDKVFSGGLDVFAGSVDATLAAGAGSSLVLGTADAAHNMLGAGDVRVGNVGALLDLKSSGGASAGQAVALNGGRLTAEFGAMVRLTEQDARNALALQLNAGTLDGGTNATRGTLYLLGTEPRLQRQRAGRQRGGELARTRVRHLRQRHGDAGHAQRRQPGRVGRGAQDRHEHVAVRRLRHLRCRLAVARGRPHRVRHRHAEHRQRLDVRRHHADDQPVHADRPGDLRQGPANVAGGNSLRTTAGATGTLGLAGFDQTFGSITLAANSRLHLVMQPSAPTPMTLAIGSLNGSGLSIFGWRGNPDTHVADGTATLTDSVSFGSANLAAVWFRGFDPGAVVGTDGVLRPRDFLHSAWTGGAGAVSGTTFRWFDLANWNVDAPSHAGAEVTFGALASAVTASLESRSVPIGRLITNSSGRLTVGTGTLVFDSGVIGTAFLHRRQRKRDARRRGIAQRPRCRHGGHRCDRLAPRHRQRDRRPRRPLAGRRQPVLQRQRHRERGRLTLSDPQSLGPAPNTLQIMGGEVYAGSNALNARTITNPVTFGADFTAGFIEFGYAGDVAWPGTRTITGDGTVGFGQDLRLTGTGALSCKAARTTASSTSGTTTTTSPAASPCCRGPATPPAAPTSTCAPTWSPVRCRPARTTWAPGRSRRGRPSMS
jgi:hypothetical protein